MVFFLSFFRRRRLDRNHHHHHHHLIFLKDQKKSYGTIYNQAVGCVKLLISESAYTEALRQYLEIKKSIESVQKENGNKDAVHKHVTYVAVPSDKWTVINSEIPCMTLCHFNDAYYGDSGVVINDEDITDMFGSGVGGKTNPQKGNRMSSNQY